MAIISGCAGPGLDPAAALFHSLGDPKRLAIAQRMARGEVRVGDLAGELGLALCPNYGTAARQHHRDPALTR